MFFRSMVNAMTSFVAAACVGTQTLSCAPSVIFVDTVKTVEVDDWRFRKVAIDDYPDEAPSERDRILIPGFIESYRRRPYKSGWNEITFSKMVRDPSGTTKYFMFNVRSVEDVNVVFVVSDSDQRLLDKFLVSTF